MKTFAIASVLAVSLLTSPALAHEHGKDGHAEAKKAALTIDTPIEQLMADEKAKAVVTKHAGGDLTQHPAYAQFKTMNLVELQPWSSGAITDDMIAKIKADLAKL
ncbi:MAG: hypothetical protein AAGK17_06620 [Pseudomonadota bacterium]